MCFFTVRADQRIPDRLHNRDQERFSARTGSGSDPSRGHDHFHEHRKETAQAGSCRVDIHSIFQLIQLYHSADRGDARSGMSFIHINVCTNLRR